MTNEEAIKYAKEIHFCTGCPVDMSIDGGKSCNVCEHRGFFELSIEALEKQIPKMYKKSNGYKEIGFCPNCLEPIKTRTTYRSSVGKISQSWCSECGQAILWEEEVSEGGNK